MALNPLQFGRKTSIGQRDDLNPGPIPAEKQAPPVAPGGVGGIATALLTNIFSGSAGRSGTGVSQDGEFDVDQFIESSLAKARNDDGGGLKKILGSLMSMFGGG